ncbi:14761_t:CDS:2, partial [Racocetra fulgida]
PNSFKHLIETEEPQLSRLLDKMTNALVPERRTEKNKIKAQQIISQCYFLAGLYSQNINKYKTDLSLYLLSCRLSTTEINFLNKAGITINLQTLYNYKEKIKNNHSIKINEYFVSNINNFYCFNIDNFHDIHTLQQPNNTTLLITNHLATCVTKPIENQQSVLAISNNHSFFNPENIEPTKIIINLTSKYNGCFDKSYNEYKMEWISSNNFQINSQNCIELLTLYIYDNAIKERKEEKSIKNIRVIKVKKLNLYSMNDYLKAFKMITNINSLSQYLKNNIIPIIADWPGQLFIKKIIIQSRLNPNLMPNNVKNFILILAKKLRSWRINLILELIHEG